MTSVIVPVLRAVGFERGPGALRMPPANGVRMPTARFQPLGADVAVEYAKMPQLLRPQTRRMLECLHWPRTGDSRDRRGAHHG